MGFVGRLAGSEIFMSAALVVVPWAFARAFAYWKAAAARRRDERYERAIEALEIGVDEAWDRLGRAWKRARKDGKLTDDERGKLRECAVEVARDVGREEGLDVVKTVGARALKAVIRKIVSRRKLGM